MHQQCVVGFPLFRRELGGQFAGGSKCFTHNISRFKDETKCGVNVAMNQSLLHSHSHWLWHAKGSERNLHKDPLSTSLKHSLALKSFEQIDTNIYRLQMGFKKYGVSVQIYLSQKYTFHWISTLIVPR